jgi:SPP1 family predicted phage head-tail adaptor
MTAGKYKHRVEFQAKATVQDEYGEPVDAWQTVIECWGLVHYLTGRELWAAKQANSEVTGRVELRYRDDISPEMRIKYRDRFMDIESIVPLEHDRREIHVNFKERL